MATYREREDELFSRWKRAFKERDGVDPESNFAADGLLFRGEYAWLYDSCWERQSGNESEIWESAKCRLLILTKDTTRNSELFDIRIETALQNISRDIKVPAEGIYRNLTLWSYALLNAVQGGEILEYDMLPNWDILREHYASAPIARVNCKKQIGGSSVSNEVLQYHIERYSDLLSEQIAMYDADIILCGGGSGTIKNFVQQHYLTDLQAFSTDAWVYFSPSTGKIVIDSYHPSYLVHSNSDKNIKLFYSQMMEDVTNFLKAHPEYIKR